MSRLPFAIRRLGAAITASVPVRIRSGPNAGLRWTLASSGRGYRAGTFEADRVQAITGLLRPGDRFWDIGAHKGYISLAAARRVGARGQVVSFEPAALNRDALRRHLSWNGIENVRVVPAAVSDADGEVRFGGTGSSLAYRFGEGDELVATRSIASLIEDDRLAPPTVLKIDAEGSEAAILRGAARHLSPEMLIWISVHTRALYHECLELLTGHGFRVFESAAMRARSRDPSLDWGGDQELLAVGAERGVEDAEVRALPLFADPVGRGSGGGTSSAA